MRASLVIGGGDARATTRRWRRVTAGRWREFMQGSRLWRLWLSQGSTTLQGMAFSRQGKNGSGYGKTVLAWASLGGKRQHSTLTTAVVQGRKAATTAAAWGAVATISSDDAAAHGSEAATRAMEVAVQGCEATITSAAWEGASTISRDGGSSARVQGSNDGSGLGSGVDNQH